MQIAADLVTRLNSQAFGESKAAQLTSISQCWMVEGRFADDALAVISETAITQAIERQSAYLAARQEAEAKAASDRAAKGEPPPKPYDQIGNVAIFSLSGPMTKQETSMSYYFGGTSTVKLRRAIRAAADDPSVKCGLLLTESPGGQAQGTSDLADEIRKFGASKPIYAFVDGMAASAAYWAASACNGIYASRMAQVGCIGTYQVIDDMSQAFAAQGIKRKVYKEGEMKGAGIRGTEITPAMDAEFSREVKELNAVFLPDVKSGRKMTDAQLAKVSDGRIHVGASAQSLGLIDGICSLDECLSAISQGQSPASSTPAGKPAPTPAKPKSSATMETRMNIFQKLAAVFRGDPEQAAEAGFTDEDLASIEAAAAVDSPQALASRVIHLEQALATSRMNQVADAANKFWNELITPDADGRALAEWSQEDGIKQTFTALACMNGGPRFGKDGGLAITPELATFMETQRNAPKNYLQAKQIAGGKPVGIQPNLDDIAKVAKGANIAHPKEFAKKVVAKATTGDE